jgi:hypothetical protein
MDPIAARDGGRSGRALGDGPSLVVAGGSVLAGDPTFAPLS